VGGEVIQDNNIARTQAWQKHMTHIFAKDVGVNCSIDGHAGRGAIHPNRRDHRCGAPMTMRGVIDYALALLGSASQTCHVCFCARFIEEHEPGRIERGLSCLPFLTACSYV